MFALLACFYNLITKEIAKMIMIFEKLLQNGAFLRQSQRKRTVKPWRNQFVTHSILTRVSLQIEFKVTVINSSFPVGKKVLKKLIFHSSFSGDFSHVTNYKY